MHRFALVSVLLLLSLVSVAQDAPDKNITMLASDLHALGRVTSVAKELPDSRQVLLAIIDSDVETLRMPRGDGTYQWAALQREDGGRIRDEKTVEQVHTETVLRNVTVTGANGYRVEVNVPRKRGTFAANNRVWVRNVIADITAFDGKTSHHEIPVNAWVNPGDSNGVALPDIGKSVKATAELGVESGSKAAVAEVAIVQAKLVDDPASPYFPAVKKLLAIRDLTSARDMNRGAMKNTIDEALLALPGELQKRTVEQQEAARVRKMMAEAGTTTGAIALGDATPDVVNELADIGKKLSGTLQEQTDARARLDALVAKLKPAALLKPDLVGVLAHCPIRGKIPAPRRVQNRHPRPLLLIRPRCSRALLRLDVRREVGAVEVTIVAAKDVHERFEDAAAHRLDAIDHCRELRTRRKRGPHLRDLLGGVAEDEHVLFADLLADLDVRAVERADDHRAVQHRFHAARARRLCARGRDLFGQLCRGEQHFRGGHVVVRHEHDVQPLRDDRVRAH